MPAAQQGVQLPPTAPITSSSGRRTASDKYRSHSSSATAAVSNRCCSSKFGRPAASDFPQNTALAGSVVGMPAKVRRRSDRKVSPQPSPLACRPEFGERMRRQCKRERDVIASRTAASRATQPGMFTEI